MFLLPLPSLTVGVAALGWLGWWEGETVLVFFIPAPPNGWKPIHPPFEILRPSEMARHAVWNNNGPT